MHPFLTVSCVNSKPSCELGKTSRTLSLHFCKSFAIMKQTRQSSTYLQPAVTFMPARCLFIFLWWLREEDHPRRLTFKTYLGHQIKSSLFLSPTARKMSVIMGVMHEPITIPSFWTYRLFPCSVNSDPRYISNNRTKWWMLVPLCSWNLTHPYLSIMLSSNAKMSALWGIP